jgi:hypothetical protein
VTDFANRLAKRTGGGVAEELSDSVKHRLKEVGLSLQWLDSNFGSRIIFAGIMVIYSAFVLGWGSHVLGAAIVILPVPLLLLLTYFATRGRSFQNWPLELLVMIGAAMIPFAWYLVFLNLQYCIRPSWCGPWRCRQDWSQWYGFIPQRVELAHGSRVDKSLASVSIPACRRY